MSEPVHIKEILPDVMQDIRRRMELNRQNPVRDGQCQRVLFAVSGLLPELSARPSTQPQAGKRWSKRLTAAAYRDTLKKIVHFEIFAIDKISTGVII